MQAEYPLGLALLAYGAGLFLSLYQLWKGKLNPAPMGILSGIAMSAQLLDLLMRAESGGRPWQSLSGALLMASLLSALTLLSLRSIWNTQGMEAFSGALPFTLLVMGALIRQDGAGPIPHSGEAWALVHVPFAAMGLAVLGVSALAVGAYKLKGRLLKEKKLDARTGFLPSLEKLDKIVLGGALIGFFFITLGLVTGALWASHGELLSAWKWHLKEIAALLAWMVYAAYLYVRLVAKWQGAATSLLLMIGFILVLIVFAAQAWKAPGL